MRERERERERAGEGGKTHKRLKERFLIGRDRTSTFGPVSSN